MKYRAVTLAVLVCLQGCASLSLPQEKQACPAFVAYPQLAAPPDNVEQLYALDYVGRPRRGYHEHWYKLDDNTLGACRHRKRERGSCSTEEIWFTRTINGWEMGSKEVVVCAN